MGPGRSGHSLAPGAPAPRAAAGARAPRPVLRSLEEAPVRGVRAQAVPSAGLATPLIAQPRSAGDFPSTTPTPAESREDAELGLRAEAHRPGHGPGCEALGENSRGPRDGRQAPGGPALQIGRHPVRATRPRSPWCSPTPGAPRVLPGPLA